MSRLLPSIDVRDFGCSWNTERISAGKLRVDDGDFLELVEEDDDATVAFGAELRGQLEQALERRVDVLVGVRRREAEARRAVPGRP